MKLLKVFRLSSLSAAVTYFAVSCYWAYKVREQKVQLITFSSLDQNCRECCHAKVSCGLDCAHYKLGQMINLIKSAKVSLDVCVLLITNVSLVEALLYAHDKGVKVRVIVDGEMSRNKYSQTNTLEAAGVPVLKNQTNATMHHKFCVIDKKILLDGSLNWTFQAFTGNFEIVCVIRKQSNVKKFAYEFDQLWQLFSDKDRNVSQNTLLDSIGKVQSASSCAQESEMI